MDDRPVAGALLLRITAWGFLKTMAHDRSHWGFFFVLALKAGAHPPSFPKEFRAILLTWSQCCRKGCDARVEPAHEVEEFDFEEEEDEPPAQRSPVGLVPQIPGGFLGSAAAASAPGFGSFGSRDSSHSSKGASHDGLGSFGTGASDDGLLSVGSQLSRDARGKKGGAKSSSKVRKHSWLHETSEPRQLRWRCVRSGV